jgi:hypothetical protein
MQAGAFGYPFEYWVGMDTDPRTTPEALAEFNRFYSTTHVAEVMAAHAGFVGVSRYELVEPDPPGEAHRGPRWLAVYEIADEASAEQYLKDNERPWLHRRRYSPWPPARKRAKTIWRMLWRNISSGSMDAAPRSIYLVGTNTRVTNHQKTTRLELYRAFAHPPPGCPQFCLVHEGTEPATGDADDAVWRLGYRRIPPPDEPVGQDGGAAARDIA